MSKSEFVAVGEGWKIEAFESPSLADASRMEKTICLVAGSWFLPEEATKLRDALTKALDFLSTLT